MEFEFNKNGVCMNPQLLHAISCPGLKIEIWTGATLYGWDAAVKITGVNFGNTRGVWKAKCNQSKTEAIQKACVEVMSFLDMLEKEKQFFPKTWKNEISGWGKGQQLSLF